MRAEVLRELSDGDAGGWAVVLGSRALSGGERVMVQSVHVPPWFAPVAVVALAAAMLLTAALAHADAPTLADRVAHLVPGYGSKKVELVDAEEFGAAVDTACNHDRECAARLVTMGIVESALSLSLFRAPSFRRTRATPSPIRTARFSTARGEPGSYIKTRTTLPFGGLRTC